MPKITTIDRGNLPRPNQKFSSFLAKITPFAAKNNGNDLRRLFGLYSRRNSRDIARFENQTFKLHKDTCIYFKKLIIFLSDVVSTSFLPCSSLFIVKPYFILQTLRAEKIVEIPDRGKTGRSVFQDLPIV